jgi:hypothetical protein
LTITAANATSVAGEASLGGLGASAFGSVFEFAAVVGPVTPKTHILTNVVKQAIALIGGQIQSPVLIGAAATSTNSACLVGGSTTVTADPVALTASITFNNCSDAVGESLNGTFSAASIQLVLNTSFSATAAINIAFKQTGVPDLALQGSNISVNELVSAGPTDTVTMSGQVINVTSGPVSEQLGTYNLQGAFTGTTETDTITLTYASTSLGGLVNVSTGAPCVTSLTSFFPHSGVLNITGANNTKLQVTINGDETLGGVGTQVSVGVDADGNGSFETTQNKNWQDLDTVN